MCYLGAAIWEGQKIKGVEKTPNILREAQLFKGLKEKFGVEVVDLGNVQQDNVKIEQGEP